MNKLASAALLAALAACSSEGKVTAPPECAGVPPRTLDAVWTSYFGPAGCAACHAGGSGGFKYRNAHELWQAAVNVPSTADPAMRVAPGDPDHSLLYRKLLAGAWDRMPQGGPYLPDEGAAAVRGWICAGAPEPALPDLDGGADAGPGDGGAGDGGAADGGADGGSTNPAPTLTSISPTSVAAGSPDTTVTLAGSSFIATSSVELDGTALATTFASSSSLTAVVPAAQLAVAGSHTVAVVNPAPGGGTSGGVAFDAVNPSPTLTSITPASVATNGAVFTLTADGAGFVSGAQLLMNGSAVPTTWVSPAQLTGQIPTIATAGSYAITVQNPSPCSAGCTSGSQTLTAAASSTPTITGLSPASAAANAAFTLTVSGSGYVCTGQGSAVLFNGSALTPATCSTTQLAVAVPATAAGAYPVLVKIVSTGVTSNTVNYDVVAPNPVPSLTSLSPSSALAGSGAMNLAVNGANFVSTSSVLWNGAARTTTFVSASQVTAALGAADLAAAGTDTVAVTNPAPGGGTSGTLDFTVNNPVPAIASLSPSVVGTGSGAFTLSVSGSSFVSGSTVQVDGSARTTTFVNAGLLTAALTSADDASAGTHTITVFTGAPGGGTSNGVTLSVQTSNPVPAVAALSPCGLVAGNGAFTLTIDGSGFVAASTATFNGSAVTVTYVSASQLTAAIPSSLVASAPSGDVAPVVVTNPSPGGGASNTYDFGVAKQLSTLSANVQSIFTASCATTGCHVTGGAAPMSLESGQSYGNLVNVVSPNFSGAGCADTIRVIQCGPLRSQSVLADKVLATKTSPPCYGTEMPKGGAVGFGAAQIQLIVDWIAQGAPQ